ncbi:hypothetical protein [Bradyrhizobium sp. SBR1B]|uniref:hypothetical protein n=1 Tax=Bradyrhizobium sp. SBR1B TaxID=2663836 RepID=UPI001605CE6B|nr:hypothetical protein [Bradyrhizobium sp. SBR1B]MBB4383653.1 hypothetical protein [Bradyrhizobium sp. SBR1B]
MTKRKLSDFEKVRTRADYLAKRGKQFSPVDIKDVQVEDWTDENGKPVIIVQT